MLQLNMSLSGFPGDGGTGSDTVVAAVNDTSRGNGDQSKFVRHLDGAVSL